MTYKPCSACSTFFRIRRFPRTRDFPCYNQKVLGKPVWPLGRWAAAFKGIISSALRYNAKRRGSRSSSGLCRMKASEVFLGKSKGWAPLQEKVPAQILVRVWMTIHLCSKELVDVSKMFRKISLKKTYMARRRKGQFKLGLKDPEALKSRQSLWVKQGGRPGVCVGGWVCVCVQVAAQHRNTSPGGKWGGQDHGEHGPIRVCSCSREKA